jgi:hypothetical protein
VDAEYLKQLVDDAEVEVAPNVTQLALKMKEFGGIISTMEEQLKILKEKYDDIRKRQLPDAMAAAGLKSVKLVEGGQVYVQTKVQAGVLAADREGLHNWLRDNGHASLIVPTVHPSTLTAWAKEQKAAGAPIPPQVRVYEEPLAVFRK